MKLTMDELFTAATALTSIINSRRDLPHRCDCALAKIHKRIRPLSLQSQDLQATLMEECGGTPISGPGGQTFWNIPVEKTKEYREKWKAASQNLVDLGDDFRPLDPKIFPENTFDAWEIVNLGPLLLEMLEEPEAPAPASQAGLTVLDGGKTPEAPGTTETPKEGQAG